MISYILPYYFIEAYKTLLSRFGIQIICEVVDRIINDTLYNLGILQALCIGYSVFNPASCLISTLLFCVECRSWKKLVLMFQNFLTRTSSLKIFLDHKECGFTSLLAWRTIHLLLHVQKKRSVYEFFVRWICFRSFHVISIELLICYTWVQNLCFLQFSDLLFVFLGI